ncbi:MAG: hemerythrin family protein [Proteobacteria bacterium]|nr:hemerythrin family protein [Pseudomonadota bacterium]
MALMEWNDSYSVGVNHIDDQHRKLIEMLSNFLESVEMDSERAKTTLINALIDYTKYHFSNEEKCFDKFNYSDKENHKKEHQIFIDKVRDIQNRLEAGNMVLTMEIAKFLREWLINHIKVSDKQYSQCFNENGLI